MAVLSGPFEIQEVLGEGAFGAVFVARLADDPLRRRIALKVLKREYASNPKVLNRTRDEARLLSRIQHPNIVRVERLVDLHGRPALIMELVHGISLKRLIQRNPNGLPVCVALEVIRQTCVALHTAFHEGFGDDGRPLRVIHRDIKPSNMLLSVHGELKVVDFGIATGQFAEREAETESLVMGSRPYMAPERLDGAADTPAVDIYSAGMSLYEMLSGKLMNLSVNAGSHARSLNTYVERLALPNLPPDLAHDIRQLVRRMCSYDTDYRPSARDAAANLGKLIDRLGPEQVVTLPDYARTVVVPLFEARERRPVDGMSDFLGDGVEAEPVPGTPPWLQRRPVAFAAALSLGIVVLAGLAFAKSARQRVVEPLPTTHEVKIWIPRDVRARVGTSVLSTPGTLHLEPGEHQLDLTTPEGGVLLCSVRTHDGMAIRYVVQDGEGGISIDDGPARPCQPIEAAAPTP